MSTSVLTPEARLERAKRQIAEGVADMIEATIARAGAGGEWVDQNHSPLGKRKHLRLAAKKKIPSRKHGKQVLIRRDDLNTYIECEGIGRGKRAELDDVEDVVERMLRRGQK